jgi:pimeloyl-ACP methyl ester carboxylesterase
MFRIAGPKRLLGLLSLAVATTVATGIVSAPTASAKVKKPKTTKVKKGGAAPKTPAKSTLVWRSCDDPLFQCTEISVPVDPANPAGATLSLSLVKRPLASGIEKLGTLITGGGFPGASGVNSMKSDVRIKTIANPWAKYDVIAFEHRGTGTSSPMGCATKATELGFDAFATGTADTITQLLTKWRATCTDKNRDLIGHMGVADSVADLEALRVALAEPQLTFEFWNHDATIGAAYASKFPTNVRANVMFDPYPLASVDNYILDQAADTATAINRFLDTCQSAPACPLSTGAGAKARFDALLEKLVKTPVPAGKEPADGFIGALDAAAVVENSLNDETTWNNAAKILVALENNDPAPYLELDPGFSAGVWPVSTLGGPFWSIACLDGLYPGTETEATATLITIFRSSMAATILYAPYISECTEWPVRSNRMAESSFRSTVPTLVMSQRGDLPDKWATNASALVTGSVVATYGIGEASNTCIERTVTSFLEQLALPSANTAC